jgi:hypothetical protein
LSLTWWDAARLVAQMRATQRQEAE